MRSGDREHLKNLKSDKYDGRYMREAHQALVEEQGLSSEHFDAVAEDLMETLK